MTETVPAVNRCCLSVREVSRRWRCRVSTVRAMVRSGALPAIVISGRVKIPPESITAAERGLLAVRPRKQRQKQTIDKEVATLLRE